VFDPIASVLFVLWICISAVPLMVVFIYWHKMAREKNKLVVIPLPILLVLFLILSLISLYSVIQLFRTNDTMYAALALGCALVSLLVHELVNV